ncbi:nitroreductase family protein [Wielerella bovis]|uniref:nitroreductase family protein n=1 Tax=Wielerella bovis TaxID=2917790 RepID=UPI0020188636|nr:nitroreductase family protein [Wielerella bovis]ULJ64341.1 nitroreductase family protein [Wielerella bovis]ULJ66560.1 nitroreductase family protein [Wielerella bovis]
MDSLELLTTRRSSKNLFAPAPDELQLDSILQAATQVPDHGGLTPWRFVVINSETGLQRFQAALCDTVTHNQMGEEAMKKAERVGKMAPMVIAVIASPKAGKPEWEQTLSAGCAAYAIQLAANAQGFDNVWITGMWVHSPILRDAFACTESEKIIGLMMIGTGENPAIHQPKNTDVNEFTQYW